MLIKLKIFKKDRKLEKIIKNIFKNCYEALRRIYPYYLLRIYTGRAYQILQFQIFINSLYIEKKFYALMNYTKCTQRFIITLSYSLR